MTEPPRVDAELIRRLNRPEIEATAVRLRAMAAAGGPGAPPEVHRFGRATAFCCPALPELNFYNVVWNLSTENLGQLDDILGVYQRHGIRTRVRAFPGLIDHDVERALAAAGLTAQGWLCLLYRLPQPVPAPVDGVTVRRVGPDEGVLFADTMMEGFGFAPEQRDAARPAIAGWTEIDWFWCYLAEVDGEPAGIGVLECLDGVGYLAAACTVESARGKGCQSALITARIRDAAAAGCDVLCVETGFATQSMKNQERFGFRLAATACDWVQPRPASA